MKERYAGFVKSPDAWWLSLSKKVYDAFDLPEGPIRDGILSAAQAFDVLHNLGPASMSSMEAWKVALPLMGARPGEGYMFEALTDRGRDFLNGTGEFSTEEDR